MTPLRIAYVVNVFPKLSETFIAHELAELRRRGVQLRVLSLRQPVEELRHDLIAANGLDQLTSYDTDRFLPELKEFRPHLLHAHFATEPAAAAREFAEELHVPFTFTAHGYDIRRKAPPDFAFRAATARRVVTVSHANARHITSTFGVPLSHLRVIPCGVDTTVFRPLIGPRSSRREEAQTSSSPIPASESGTPLLGRHEAHPLLVCVARLVAVKNLGLLLRACALLRDRGVAFRCVLVGDGPLRSELEALRRELNLEDLVKFHGAANHREVLRFWQRASVALLTSENEGMPVSLMEAAACGVPAVATAVGGIPELVEQRVTGLLTPPGDAAAFADAVQDLIENPARAATMGQAARRRAETKFSLSRQVDELLALWSEILR